MKHEEEGELPFFGDGTSTNKKKKEIAGGGAKKKAFSTCLLTWNPTWKKLRNRSPGNQIWPWKRGTRRWRTGWER
jgi:hypothetical protein